MFKLMGFRTPTLFDLSAITTMGMNVKPNSDNPIGYFGTGLKYAIAVLLREGAKISLYCNGNHYTFYTKKKAFSGKSFDQCMFKQENFALKLKRWSELPYTTELGKNWELWMAFRELYSNTLDENGDVFTMSLEEMENLDVGKDETFIMVEHLEFAKIYDVRDTIFLDHNRPVAYLKEGVGSITENKSEHVYFRGMRALDLQEEQKAMFTYNIIAPTELTEDRVIKNQYLAKARVQDLVTQCTDKTLIKKVLLAPEKTFEKSLDFEYSYGASKEFKEALTELRDNRNVNPSAVRRYYHSYISPPKTPKCTDAVWSMIMEALEDARSDLELGEADEDGVHDHYVKAMQNKFER